MQIELWPIERVKPYVAAVDEFCHEHGQSLAIVTDEVEEPVIPRFAWSPPTCPYSSFAIQLEK